MNFYRFIIVTALGVLILLPPIWSWSCLDHAERKLIALQASYVQTQRDAAELLELRAMEDRIADRKRPDEHVLAQVNRVIAEAGLSSRSLQGVRPEADTALSGPRNGVGTEYRRQSVAISLQTLTLTEIGAFLLRWRKDTTVWIPSRIELVKHRSRSSDDDRYDARIVISAIYVAEPD